MMAGENQSEIADARRSKPFWLKSLDGTLHGPMLVAFEAHQQTCPSCQAMMQEARAGMHWLQGLDEAEPPSNLMHNILAQTIGALPSEHIVPAPRGDSWLDKVKARLAPVFAPVATPRFAMSFGMAFFSPLLCCSALPASISPTSATLI